LLQDLKFATTPTFVWRTADHGPSDDGLVVTPRIGFAGAAPVAVGTVTVAASRIISPTRKRLAGIFSRAFRS
jgi:hypothetical protein